MDRGLLFASTVINYIDRQTLALLSPYLKETYHWTNTDYANLLIGFRIAYSVGQTVCGRFMDRVGTRRGLSLSVLWYSIVSIATSLSRGFYSFVTFRFLLGAGESANWPMRQRPCPSGFRNRRERWPRHFSTAVLPLAARSLLLLSCQSISVGDGVPCSSFRDC